MAQDPCTCGRLKRQPTLTLPRHRMCENLSSQSRSSPAASSAVFKSLACEKKHSSLTLLAPHHSPAASSAVSKSLTCEKTFRRSRSSPLTTCDAQRGVQERVRQCDFFFVAHFSPAVPRAAHHACFLCLAAVFFSCVLPLPRRGVLLLRAPSAPLITLASSTASLHAARIILDQ